MERSEDERSEKSRVMKLLPCKYLPLYQPVVNILCRRRKSYRRYVDDLIRTS